MRTTSTGRSRARFGRDPRRHLVGAYRERGSIVGDENTRHAARASSSASVILSRFKRPSGSPSRRAEGEVAQIFLSKFLFTIGFLGFYERVDLILTSDILTSGERAKSEPE